MTTIRKAEIKDIDELLVMSADLWPDYTYEELQGTFTGLLFSERANVLLAYENGVVQGFIYMGIRTDYVQGADLSPTGFVEGIYVKPFCRKQGVARHLLAAGERWVKECGCTQVGSDIYINNQASYDFHACSGFREAGRLIAFIKDIG